MSQPDIGTRHTQRHNPLDCVLLHNINPNFHLQLIHEVLFLKDLRSDHHNTAVYDSHVPDNEN